MEAKDHLRAGCVDDEDAYIASLVKAARRYVESQTARSLLETTWQLSLDCFPRCNWIELRVCPVLEVLGMSYVDLSGNTQAWGTENYLLDTDSEPGRLSLAYAKTWPSIRHQPNAVQVTFKAGYGDTPASVPESLKHAMKLMIGHWYENRESVVSDAVPRTVPLSVDALINMHRWTVYG